MILNKDNPDWARPAETGPDQSRPAQTHTDYRTDYPRLAQNRPTGPDWPVLAQMSPKLAQTSPDWPTLARQAQISPDWHRQAQTRLSQTRTD